MFLLFFFFFSFILLGKELGIIEPYQLQFHDARLPGNSRVSVFPFIACLARGYANTKTFNRIVETELGEAVIARTNGMPFMKHLGVPDLVHLAKTETARLNGSMGGSADAEKAVTGSYYYVTGVDNSSTSSVAAYLNELINISNNPSPEQNIAADHSRFGQTAAATAAWLFGWNQAPQQVHMGVYCTYNAFNRTDLRVMFKIPGSVETYTVDEEGNKWTLENTEFAQREWRMAWVSSLLRALLFDDQYSANQDGPKVKYWCRLNPLDQMTDPKFEHMFFNVFQEFFLQGPSLGLSPTTIDDQNVLTQPTLACNSLVDGFLKYVQLSPNSFEPALAALDALLATAAHSEDESAITTAVLTVKAKLYLMNNQEIQAIQIMCNTVNGTYKESAASHLLDLQAGYCMAKGKYSWALACAMKAVKCEPTEFKGWATMVRIYSLMNEYELALVTLNACPVETTALSTKAMDFTVTPPPRSEYYPTPDRELLEDLWNQPPDANDVLPGPRLTGLYTEAYRLLAAIAQTTGWDDLLKYRSRAFIMEDEYQQMNKRYSKVIEKPKPILPKVTKRLCERWLDDLFMVLYEDLRVYTLWRAEHLYFESQNLHDTPKTALEWEALGKVALRLHYYDDAAGAFQNSIACKFSVRVAWNLLDYYEGRHLHDNVGGGSGSFTVSEFAYPQLLLDIIVKLMVYNHRWYNNFSPRLLVALRRLVAVLGATKVASSVYARFASPEVDEDGGGAVVKLVESALQQLAINHAEGTEE